LRTSALITAIIRGRHAGNGKIEAEMIAVGKNQTVCGVMRRLFWMLIN
jgi:hypothetical protein